MLPDRSIAMKTPELVIAACMVVSGLGIMAVRVDAAPREDCTARTCSRQVAACKLACGALTKRGQKIKCKRKCKGRMQRACRRDELTCGENGGGPVGPSCQTYTDSCTHDPSWIADLSVPIPTAPGEISRANVGFVALGSTEQLGSCCVIDGCAGVTISPAMPGFVVTEGPPANGLRVGAAVSYQYYQYPSGPGPYGTRGQKVDYACGRIDQAAGAYYGQYAIAGSAAYEWQMYFSEVISMIPGKKGVLHNGVTINQDGTIDIHGDIFDVDRSDGSAFPLGPGWKYLHMRGRVEKVCPAPRRVTGYFTTTYQREDGSTCDITSYFSFSRSVSP